MNHEATPIDHFVGQGVDLTFSLQIHLIELLLLAISSPTVTEPCSTCYSIGLEHLVQVSSFELDVELELDVSSFELDVVSMHR